MKRSSVVLPLVLTAALVLMACKPYEVEQPGVAPDNAVGATANDGAPPPDPRVVDLHKAAEQRIFPQMKPALVEFIKAQDFFVEVTPAEYTMLETFRDMGKAAEKYGTEPLFMDTLRLATEQWWYTDGFDDNEAKAMTALFRAYIAARDDRGVDDIDKLMASSIRGNYFYVLNLPESGEVTVVLSADPRYEGIAPQALQQVVENLPKVESIVGKFPYKFIYVDVTALDPSLGGQQRNEFVWLSGEHVTTEVVSHELTHATVYGLFPTWFEEGFAYFMGYYAEGTLESVESEYLGILASTKLPRKLNLSLKFEHTGYGYVSALVQGFLFFKGYSDLIGLDAMGQTIRALRGKTYTNDNELLRAIVTNSPPDKQQQVQTYLCGAVLGLRSGC